MTGLRVAIVGQEAGEAAAWTRVLTDAGVRVQPHSVDADLVLACERTAAAEELGRAARIAVCDRLDPVRVSSLLRAGVVDILVKPVTAREVLDACLHAMPRLPPRPLRAPSRPPAFPIEGAVANAIARTRLPVLLVGETGTGKSRLARLLHETMTPAAPFVEVNAGALASNLVTSELFGHERGAFTGAHASKPGLAALADGGILFLDEIGELAIDAQAQLLSFLDTGVYRQVGGIREIRSDARVMCASNRDLPAMVAAGRFREDLYYRIASIVVTLDPLRSAPDRIPGLARDLMRHAAERAGIAAPELDAGAVELLVQHPWPGNVRQLRFVVERLVALADGALVTAAELAPFLPSAERSNTPVAVSERVRSLAEMERELVERAMHKAGGNRTRAAELLGITPRGLYNKLRRNASGG